jgi:hypothetical protein
MDRAKSGYLAATRHPWPCLIFLLPLLAVYEGGIWWLGGKQPEALRNGADTWLHWGLEAFGLAEMYWAPVLVGLLFVLWSWVRWSDRPDGLAGIWAGMAFESLLYASGLLGLSRALGPALDGLGIIGAASPPAGRGLAQVVTYVGAGIYEEMLFRLLIFGGTVWALRQAAVPVPLAVGASAAGAALLFSAAHHAGPYGEPYTAYVFVFRTVAGLYFTVVYQLRGFGVAVGAHAWYDVLAGGVIG